MKRLFSFLFMLVALIITSSVWAEVRVTHLSRTELKQLLVEKRQQNQAVNNTANRAPQADYSDDEWEYDFRNGSTAKWYERPNLVTINFVDQNEDGIPDDGMAQIYFDDKNDSGDFFGLEFHVTRCDAPTTCIPVGYYSVSDSKVPFTATKSIGVDDDDDASFCWAGEYGGKNAYGSYYYYYFITSGTISIGISRGDIIIRGRCKNSNGRYVYFNIGYDPEDGASQVFTNDQPAATSFAYTTAQTTLTQNGTNNLLLKGEMTVNNSSYNTLYYSALKFVVPSTAYNGQYIPSGSYDIASSGSNYVVKSNGNVSSKIPSASAMKLTYSDDANNPLYFFPYSGKVLVVNPNKTKIPMYVRMDNCNTYGFGQRVVFGEEPALYQITMGTPANGSNTLSSNDGHGYPEGGVISGSTGNYYYEGTVLTLTPIPNSGYEFDSWTGASPTDNGDGTYSLTVNASTTITANFRAAVSAVDVTLNSNGGSNDGQVVSATNGSAMPTTLKAGGAIAAPAKTGYTFDGYVANSDGTGKKYYNANLTSANNWDKTVATTIYAKWSPNTNTAYTVKHYLQNMDCSTYPAAPFVTENLIGKTDASVTPSVKAYTGFTAPSTQTVTILADGSRVVNYYYTRNQYAVTVTKNGNAYGTLTSESDNQRVISNVPYGSSISVSGNTITINGTTITATVADADDLFTYSFNAWKNGETVLTGSSNTVTGTMTITAHFARNLMSALTLKDMESATYYDNFQAYNTEDVGTVTYTRNFTAGNWSTLCLPFDVTEGNLILNGLSGQVFAFQHATGNANVGNQVLLYFSQVSSLDAGVPYLVRTRSNKSNFTFENVIINTEADTQTDIKDLPKTHMTEGTIAMVGTLRKGTLPKGDKHYMGLMGNKIYYPGENTTVPAYRAYFYDSNPSGVQQRVRIVVDGVDMGELLIDNGELLDAGGDDRAPRKYIRNGNLYIEREGVIYDAQGKRM